MNLRISTAIFYSAGLSFFLFAAAEMVPVIGWIANFFCPVPLIILTLQFGWPASFISGIIGTLLIFRVFEFQAGLQYFFWCAAVALVMAGMIRKKFSAGKTIAAGSAVFLAGTVLMLLFLLFVMRENPVKEFFEQLSANINQSLRQMGDNPDLLKDAGISRITGFLYKIWYGLLVIYAVTTVVLYYEAGNLILRHLKMPAVSMPGFCDWKIPDWWIWEFILGAVCAISGKYFKIGIAEILGLNLLIIAVFICFIVGLSILGFYFRKWRLPFLLRWLGYFVAALNLWPVVVVAGLFNTWFDFRRTKGGNQ